jgi:AcrR family transcriptional regulator
MARLKAPQRKEQLLHVATRVFAKFGYDATTTASIAHAAGVTEPILYRHFGSKQELFVAITRAVSDRTIKHWKELISDIDDPAEQLREIAGQFDDHLHELADAYRVIHSALASSRDRKVIGVLREHYRQIEAFFRAIISAGQKKGAFKTSDPKTVCWHLINTGLGYAMVSQNLAPFDTFEVKNAIEFVLRALKA